MVLFAYPAVLVLLLVIDAIWHQGMTTKIAISAAISSYFLAFSDYFELFAQYYDNCDLLKIETRECVDNLIRKTNEFQQRYNAKQDAIGKTDEFNSNKQYNNTDIELETEIRRLKNIYSKLNNADRYKRMYNIFGKICFFSGIFTFLIIIASNLISDYLETFQDMFSIIAFALVVLGYGLREINIEKKEGTKNELDASIKKIENLLLE